MLKNSPLKIITILSVFFIATLAMLLKAFEYSDVLLGNQNFAWFWNALWLNIVTMTTSIFPFLFVIIDLIEFLKTFCSKNYIINKLILLKFNLVGYGDMTPLTDLGKFFCVISCIFGIFLLSMLVAVITLMITLDDDELMVIILTRIHNIKINFW